MCSSPVQKVKPGSDTIFSFYSAISDLLLIKAFVCVNFPLISLNQPSCKHFTMLATRWWRSAVVHLSLVNRSGVISNQPNLSFRYEGVLGFMNLTHGQTSNNIGASKSSQTQAKLQPKEFRLWQNLKSIQPASCVAPPAFILYCSTKDTKRFVVSSEQGCFLLVLIVVASSI